MAKLNYIYVVSNRNTGYDYNYSLKSEAVKRAKALKKLGNRVWLSKVNLSTGKSVLLKF